MTNAAHSLLDADAVALVTALQERRVSVAEHLRGVVARIAERDADLCAISHLAPGALEAATALDALSDDAARALPLFGVPVVVKEEIPVRGLVTTYGGIANSAPAPHDAEVVRRLRDAGAVIVAHSRMPELGQVPFTEGAWGATRNPWDLSRSPGGSSGGSAVALSARYVPLALGGDGGGSVRIPAAWTGVTGLKPTRTRLTTAPADGLWHDLGTFGPMARSAADLALVWRVLHDEKPHGTTGRGEAEEQAPASGANASGAGSDTPTPSMREGAPTHRHAGAPSYGQAGAAAHRRLRVGWTLGAPEPAVRIDADVAAGVEGAARVLARAGHDVRRGRVAWPMTLTAFLPQATTAVHDAVASFDHPERAERRTRQFGAIGKVVPRRLLTWSWGRGAEIGSYLERVFDRLDVLLMPVEGTAAPPIQRLSEHGSLFNQLASREGIAFTAVWNVSGHPAASVPVGLSREGLPLAVQVVGGLGADELVLDVVAQIEEAVGVLPPPPNL